MNNFNERCASCIYNDTCVERPFDCETYIDKDSVAYGTIASEEFHQDYTIQIGYGVPKIKSHLKIGNMIIYNTRHFNWLERKMWKLLLGFDIENVEE